MTVRDVAWAGRKRRGKWSEWREGRENRETRGVRMMWMRGQDGERRVVVRGMDGWTKGDRQAGG